MVLGPVTPAAGRRKARILARTGAHARGAWVHKKQHRLPADILRVASLAQRVVVSWLLGEALWCQGPSALRAPDGRHERGRGQAAPVSRARVRAPHLPRVRAQGGRARAPLLRARALRPAGEEGPEEFALRMKPALLEIKEEFARQRAAGAEAPQAARGSTSGGLARENHLFTNTPSRAIASFRLSSVRSPPIPGPWVQQERYSPGT